MNNKNNQRIIFFGTPDFVIPVLESLMIHTEVVGVVTTPDVFSSKKKTEIPSPIKAFTKTKNQNIPIFTSLQFDPEIISELQSLQPDLFVTAAYGKILPQELLNIPQLGSINIHPSLLPLYRGPSPIQTALLNGDNKTGVTIIQMDQELDHGPILKQEEIPLTGSETFVTLHQVLFQKAADLLPETIEALSNGTLVPQPQDEKKAVYCKKITKEDGFFELTNPPSKEVLDRMIRAFHPWPAAWSKLQMANLPAGKAGGEWRIVKFLPEKRIQLEGGKPMSLKDFFNGYPELQETITKLL